METITVKLEEKFYNLLERIMGKYQYTTKAEFIREAIRDKIDKLETKAALKRLEKVYGASKRRTSDGQLERAKEEAFREIAAEEGIKL